MTVEQAEELVKETEYAILAVGDDINWGDATGFFIEGYLYAIKMMNKQMINSEILP